MLKKIFVFNIGKKINLLLGFNTILICVFLLSFSVYSYRKTAQSEVFSLIQNSVALLGKTFSNLFGETIIFNVSTFEDQERAAKLCQALSEENKASAYVVILDEKEQEYASDKKYKEISIPEAAFKKGLKANKSVIEEFKFANGREIIEVIYPVIYQNKKIAVVRAGIYKTELLLPLKKKMSKLILLNVTLVLILILFSMLTMIILLRKILIKPLNRIMANLNDRAEKTSSAAISVSSSNKHLSERVAQEVSSLQQTSQSLTQMSSMTKQNAENASMANQLSEETLNLANKGNEAMQQMQGAVGAINELSSKISQIIRVIEEIAFQTNILALNAAVEAARAGEYGKGFAVVADEVRNLAHRSANSAKDTAALIQESLNNVKNSNEIVKKVDMFLKNIKESSKKVVSAVSEITTASKEQAEGINQIANAITEIDSVTSESASSAEKSVSVAEDLASQAELLKDLVFKLQLIVSGEKQSFLPNNLTCEQVALIDSSK